MTPTLAQVEAAARAIVMLLGKEAENATIERCAQVADNLATDWGVAIESDIAKEIAAAIRALKDK